MVPCGETLWDKQGVALSTSTRLCCPDTFYSLYTFTVCLSTTNVFTINDNNTTQLFVLKLFDYGDCFHEFPIPVQKFQFLVKRKYEIVNKLI